MRKDVKIPGLPESGDKSGSCVFIKPITKLKEKAVSQKGSDFGFDVAAIKKAELALDALSENFDDWMQQEVEKLLEMRDAALALHLSTESVDNLYRVSHDLKGQATTFGYPLVEKFCISLCRLIDAFQDKALIPKLLINQHVDAVRAIVNEKVTEVDNDKANTLLKRLQTITSECINYEKQRIRKLMSD